MPKIFLGYVNAPQWGPEAVVSYALAEDGAGLGSHVSSSDVWAKHDIGLESDWHHAAYDEHYPDGYELEWVGCIENSTHAGWLAALTLNQKEREDGS